MILIPRLSPRSENLRLGFSTHAKCQNLLLNQTRPRAFLGKITKG